ncbi:tetratricopeptide repeat protein [Devosia sediminis]|uniref:Tetratricopeptide repeat protein n=1 Tax=Devosia sediminis TaxID=2798801 RepID=A0A934ISX2_9HYPH|nr:tetratricopeptide repeat protein [Devosia sediminis]MBJ3783727.1 tetratricopeptide repeat protein [Devosia sediminis]
MSDVTPPLGSLTRVDAGLATIRTMTINIGFFAAMLLLVPTLGAQVVRNPVVIEPIDVPDALADRGMTANVAANRVWDGLQEYSRKADLARQTLVAVPDSQLVEFTLPGSSLSIDAVLKQVRQFLAIDETLISGEIICQTADCVPEGQRLRLRVIRRTVEVIDMPPMGATPPEMYFAEAAAAVFDVLDPLVGAAARAITDPEGATARALRIAAGGGPDAVWARALMGDIALAEGDAAAAEIHYQAALAIDPNLAQAQLGLARAAFALGDPAGAEIRLTGLPRYGDVALETALLRADIALAQGAFEAARVAALEAAEIDPLSPQPHIRLGQIARQAGLDGEARAAYVEALAVDPGASEALSALSELYRAAGDLAAAETLLKDWVEYTPESAEALRALIALRIERDDLAGAADAYGLLALLEPLSFDEAMARAELLAGANRYAEAGDVLMPFVEADVPQPDAVLALARLHQTAGRQDKAIDLYRRYLTLGTDLPGTVEATEAVAQAGK